MPRVGQEGERVCPPTADGFGQHVAAGENQGEHQARLTGAACVMVTVAGVAVHIRNPWNQVAPQDDRITRSVMPTLA